MKPLRVGVIGLSPGNGHPFSFSAIVNGYSARGWREAGWVVIKKYLDERDPSEFGFEGARVTHAWTQTPELTDRLREACLIPHTVAQPGDLIGQVDAVLLARDDPACHAELALPLLAAGLAVFVDKPLSVEPAELEQFAPYLRRGQLMSCSGFRYARELDGLRAGYEDLGELRLLRGAVLNGLEGYGIHLLEAVCAATGLRPTSVWPVPARHASLALTMSDGSLFQLDALGDVAKTFKIDLWGTRGTRSFELRDNFTAFRRTLGHFFDMVRSARPAVAPDETLHLMHTLIAGRRALSQGRRVEVGDVAE